jgi:hypothetical protein
VSNTASKHLIVDSEKCKDLCDCGHEHEIPSTRVITGDDAYTLLAEDCARQYGAESVLLLDDENTHLAAVLHLNWLPCRVIQSPQKRCQSRYMT